MLKAGLDGHKDMELRKILNNFQELFGLATKDISTTPLVTHYIDTGDSAPIKQKPCRLSYNQKEEVNRQKQEILNNGIIEHSVSPWASPVVLVNKSVY